MWSLIPFFAEHWKTASRPVGADLGQGSFQFQFGSREDLQLVLDNRPYHFAHWMIILERWEPTISPSFPSQIPFWIKVQGVPLHLWNEATLRSIGEDLGYFECWEITSLAAKMRVHINGLLPLITEYTLEFANGAEVVATLVYEKLEKHCSKCFMLNHEDIDCSNVIPTPLQIPAPLTTKRIESGQPSRHQNLPSPHANHRSSPQLIASDSRNERERFEFKARSDSNHGPSRFGESLRKGGRGDNYQPDRSRGSSYRSEYRSNHDRYQNKHRRSPPRWVETGRRISASVYSGSLSKNRDLDRGTTQSRDRFSDGGSVSHHSSSKRNHTETPYPPRLPNPPEPNQRNHATVPEVALEEAREEIREVMVQYSNVADPSENAARKERVRLAEEHGEIEETAIRLVRNACSTLVQDQEQERETTVRERIPAKQRLGSSQVPLIQEP